MCTTTYTVIKIYNIILSYVYHLFDLWKRHTKCFIPIHFTQLIISWLDNASSTKLHPLEGLRWMVSFFQTSSPFSLVILFVLLLLEPAAMVPV